jgi:Zn-dependent protease
MLYALRHPLTFVALLAGFLLATLLRGVVQAWVAHWLGARDFELRARRRPDIRRHIDPYGAVGAALGGTGWGSPAVVGGLLGRYAYGRARGAVAVRTAVALLSGPFACVLAGMALLVAYRSLGADYHGSGPFRLTGLAPSDVLHGETVHVLDGGPEVLACLAFALLSFGVLALIPIPPLDGGRLLLALAPVTAGWQRVRYYADQNWGVGVALLLLVIPLFGGSSLLLVLIDVIAQPLIDAISG